jgi:hypothetical protein
LIKSLILFLFCSLLSTSYAFASLGDQADSITQDKVMLVAKAKSSRNFSTYTVQTIQSGSSTINEYIASNGKIFAVTWRGLDPPDLSVLLGSYYASYQAAEKIKPNEKGQRQQKIEANTLVVQKFGHMRDLRGIAYDSSLIPPGVSSNEIQ